MDSIKIENVETFGFEGAIRGMRNPMNSWERSDRTNYDNNFNLIIGPNDMELMLKLTKAGTEHRKFLRMIHVQFDLTAPRYFWSEFDTYHFNTKNSCSTMHKLLTKEPITLDLFSYNKEDEGIMQSIVDKLNEIRLQYIDKNCQNKNELLRRAKQLLPEGFYQKRTIDTNYEELMSMYFQRKSHRLIEWREFCIYMYNMLPYFHKFIDIKSAE